MDLFTSLLGQISSVTGPLTLIAFFIAAASITFRELIRRKKLSESLASKIDRDTLQLIFRYSFYSFWLLIAAWLLSTYIDNIIPMPPTNTPEGSVVATTPVPETDESEIPTPEITITLTPTETAIACPDYPFQKGEDLIISEIPLTISNLDSLVEIAFWPYTDFREAHFVQFGIDSDLLILGLSDGSIRLLDASNGDLITEASKHQLNLSDLEVYSNPGSAVRLFASSSRDSSANIWLQNESETSILKTIKYDDQAVTSIALSPLLSDLVATGDGANRVNLWALSAAKYYDHRDQVKWIDDELQAGGQFYVTDIAFSPDGNLLAASSSDGTIQLFMVHRNDDLSRAWLEPRREIQAEYISPFNLVEFSPNLSNKLYAASDQGGLSIYNHETGSLIGKALSGGPVHDFSISTDGQIILGLARSVDSSIVYLWDENGADLMILDYPSDGNGVSFSPDNRLLVVIDTAGIHVWGLDICSKGS